MALALLPRGDLYRPYQCKREYLSSNHCHGMVNNCLCYGKLIAVERERTNKMIVAYLWEWTGILNSRNGFYQQVSLPKRLDKPLTKRPSMAA